MRLLLRNLTDMSSVLFWIFHSVSVSRTIPIDDHRHTGNNRFDYVYVHMD
jgi:hypothetical protein